MRALPYLATAFAGLALGALVAAALERRTMLGTLLAPGGRGGRESGVCIDGTWVPTEEATYG
ncbi:MAG TPA: hypothetical protein VF158_12455 [Longimicrobiales bacterium]